MEIHFYVLYALAAVSIALGIMALMKIKSAIYLLEQPVVKKMSPQLNLKPVKVDQADGDASRNQSRNGTPMNRTAGPREERPPRDDRGPGGRDRMPREDRGDRGPRAEGDRGPRSEGDRGPRGEGDRGPRGEGDRGPRGDRGDRFGGRDRDRGGRDGHRGDRGDRGPRREFTGGEREPAQADSAPRPAHVEPTASTGAPLAPRRPLPSTVDAEGEVKSSPAPEITINEAGAADPFFGRDDSDIQHGRRNQLKKKPKFAAEDVEEKAPTEEKAV